MVPYNQTPQMFLVPSTQTETYFVQTLINLKKQRIIVDTVRGTIEGFLVDVKPDHIVMKDRHNDQPQLIRIAQIVYIMPIND